MIKTYRKANQPWTVNYTAHTYLRELLRSEITYLLIYLMKQKNYMGRKVEMFWLGKISVSFAWDNSAIRPISELPFSIFCLGTWPCLEKSVD